MRPIERVVIADAAGAPGQVDAELERARARARRRPESPSAAPAAGSPRARARARSAFASAIRRSRFIVIAIDVAQDSRAARASAALVETFAKPIVSNTRCTNGSRSARGGGSAVDRARQHLLRAAAGRDQPDADLDQADVALGRRLHAIAVQRDLAAAAERQAGRRDDDRHVARSAAPCVAPWNARTIRSISSQLPSCASSSSSIRFAPAEKFGASLPTTSAAKFAAASCTPACSICDACRRRSRSSSSGTRRASTPSPRSTRLAPAFVVTTPLRSFARSRGAAGPAPAGGSASVAEAVAPVAAARDQRRQRPASPVASSTSRTPIASTDLERPELPAEPPPHRAIDVVDRVGDVRRDPRGVDAASAPSVVAQELADLVLAVEQRLDPLADVVDRLAPRRATAGAADCLGR